MGLWRYRRGILLAFAADATIIFSAVVLLVIVEEGRNVVGRVEPAGCGVWVIFKPGRGMEQKFRWDVEQEQTRVNRVSS